MNKNRSNPFLKEIIFVTILIIMSMFFMSCTSDIFSKKNIQEVIELKACHLITGIPGPEDFEYLSEENILIVSSLDKESLRRHSWKIILD